MTPTVSPAPPALRTRCLLLLALGWMLGFGPAAAAPKATVPATNTPALPSIELIQPLVASPGSTLQLVLRGRHLTNVTALRFGSGEPLLSATIERSQKLETGKNADAARLGDSQLEVRVRIPDEARPGTNQLTVISPAGTSPARPWVLLPAPALVPEQEPNGGLAQAQALEPGRTLVGTLQEAADVDVFRWRGRRGDKVEFRIWAARGASALDPVLTLLDAKGRVVALADDDGASRDAVLRTTVAADGDYLLSVVDAYDRGGPGYAYLLSVSVRR